MCLKFIRVASIIIYCACVANSAHATNVVATGLFNGKAYLSINGGRARMVQAGETTADGVKLISANSDGAVVEVNGKRETLNLGQGVGASMPSGTQPSLTLSANSLGHFVTVGSINGASITFLVDTGASFISLNAQDARKAGINYRNGELGYASTANGVTPVHRVKLDTVKVGDIQLNNVDAVIHEGTNLPIALLGMSFLSRLEMRRGGNTLTLTKQY